MAPGGPSTHMRFMNDSTGLQDFIGRHQRLFVLTGAGCSTNSGIPDYRDADGQWKRAQPMTYQAFMGTPLARQPSMLRAPALLGPQHARLAPLRPGEAQPRP
jgi:hypothetical protein